MTEETILELARLYRQAERRVREGQLGVDYPTERRSAQWVIVETSTIDGVLTPPESHALTTSARIKLVRHP